MPPAATAQARRADRDAQIDVDDHSGRQQNDGYDLGAERRTQTSCAVRAAHHDAPIGDERNDVPDREERACAVDEGDKLASGAVSRDAEHPQPMNRER